MRIIMALAVVIAAGANLFGQDGSDIAVIKVIKHQWEKVRINWTRDPLSTPSGENYYELRDRVSTERRPKSALQEKAIRDAKEEKQKPTPPAKYVFVYKLSVENLGSKAIKELDWDYIFTDAATGEVIGRREFTSVEKIKAGKRKDLSITASLPPVSRISVFARGEKESDGLIEKIVISRILYEDDSVWQAQR